MMQPLHKEYQRLTSLEHASVGDIVTIELDLTPENEFVPETLFDTCGKLSFVLGWGNFLPGLHELINGMPVGEELSGISIDGGWGERNPDLFIEVPKSNLKKIKVIENITEGAVLNLQGGIQVSVMQVTDKTLIADANPPLTGSSYSCSMKVLNIEPFSTSKLQYQGSKSSTEESKNLPWVISGVEKWPL